MEKVVVSTKNGAARRVQLTDEEITDRQEESAAWEAEPVRHVVPRNVILARLKEMGKLDAAFAAFDALPRETRERWYGLPDGPFHDDPDTVALLEGIGVNPDDVLAP